MRAATDTEGPMPILRSDDAPDFDLDGIAIRGFASPSRGATETMAWRITFAPGRRLPEHTHDHEEVFHVLDGALIASLDGEETPVGPGDTVMIPAGVRHTSFTDDVSTATLLSMMPTGTVMIRDDGEGVSPPWTV
jgi:quercetin dioxygenase-like cupin family protein